MGPKGCGKSALVLWFAQLLNYQVFTVHAFKDMTSRGTVIPGQTPRKWTWLQSDLPYSHIACDPCVSDLLQQRSTDSKGNTLWKTTPLVAAAAAGGLAVLDGVDRLPPATLAAIRSLTEDRDCTLFDGTRLLRWDRFDALCSELQCTPQQLSERHRLVRIAPSFRIVALALPPARNNMWLTEGGCHPTEWSAAE